MNGAGPTTRRRLLTVGLLAAAILALAGPIFVVHGRALNYGLFMDDWAHFRQLRECDWSLQGLTDACRLELVGGYATIWWLPETTLRFFRPVSFGLMKLTYTITGWDAQAMHLASLLWHLVACVLLMLLLRRLGAALWLAWAVAAMFALHPGHVATVEWIACQTELMVTVFLLGATLCWGRFRGWPGFGHAPPTARAWPWAAATLLFYVLALGCRENAVVFPLMLAAVEPRAGKAGRRAALGAYAALGLAMIAYLLIRAVYLDGMAVPPKPYVMPPGDPGFIRFVFDKLCYYWMGEFLLVPVVPIGGLPYLRDHPFTFYGLAILVGVLFTFVCARLARRGVTILGPLWLAAFTLPLLPAFASPHHLYLPGVGWAICAMLIIQAMASVGANATGWTRWLRRGWLATSAGLLMAAFGFASYYFGLAFETGQAVERSLFEEMSADPEGLRDGDTLYVANLPLIGHYARLGVEERTGRRNLKVVPLTWAPRILGMVTPSELRWIDSKTIELRIAHDRYFTGPLGRLAHSATGHPIPDHVERTADCGFRVDVLERDERGRGIMALRYSFDRPLTGRDVHLFWGSRFRWAYELRPRWSEAHAKP